MELKTYFDEDSTNRQNHPHPCGRIYRCGPAAVGSHPGTAGRAGGSSRQELWDAQGHGTPARIDALVTVAGGAAMLGWLLYTAPFFVSLQTGVFR